MFLRIEVCGTTSMTQDKLENLSTCACDGFSVLVGKRKGLIWGYKEEEKQRFLWCSGVVWIVNVNNTIRNRRRRRRRRRKERKEQTKEQHALMLKTLNNFIICLHLTLSCISSIRTPSGYLGLSWFQ